MQVIKDVIHQIFSDLESPKKIKHRQLAEKWPAIVGTKIAAHTKPALGSNGQLTVWVDQSVLAFELKQKHQQALLKRVQAALDPETVRTLRFYVGQLR